MQNRWLPVWHSPRIWIGLAVSVGTLYLALTRLEWAQVTQPIGAAHFEWLAAALAIQTLSTLLKAARWRLLFDIPPRLSSLFPLFSAILIGQTFNILIPLRLGELARAMLVKQRLNISSAFALSTIGVEKLGDAVILGGLLVAILPFLVPPAWFQTAVLFIAVSAFGAVAMLFLLHTRKIQLVNVIERALGFNSRAQILFATRLRPILDGADALNGTRSQVLFWLLGLAAWLCAALTNYFAFRAFDLPLAAIPAVFVLIVLQAGIALPSLPGKIGVFQYACVLALSAFAIDDTSAFAFSLGLYAVVIVVTVLLGAALILGWSGSQIAMWREE